MSIIKHSPLHYSEEGYTAFISSTEGGFRMLVIAIIYARKNKQNTYITYYINYNYYILHGWSKGTIVL